MAVLSWRNDLLGTPEPIRHFRREKRPWDKCHLVLVSGTITGDKTRDEKRFVPTNDSTSHCEMILAPGPFSFLKWRMRSMGSFLKILQSSPYNSYHRIITDVSKLKFLYVG